MKNGKENLADTFERFAKIAQHKEVPTLKQQVADAEERGRNFQPAYIKSINEQTERGREMMAAARRGENIFPPARMVTGKPHKP